VHVLTQSATVTVAAVYIGLMVVAALAIRRVPLRAKKAFSFSVLAVTAIAAVLTIKFRAEIFSMVDRSSDASNRTEIWRQVISVAEQRPEGWGFVGYWPIWEQPYAGILDKANLVATHSHNAFLDAWLQLGLIGLVLLLGLLVLTFGSSWRLVERAGRGDTYIPLGWAMLTAALALQALTESRLLVEGGWFMLVALFCSAPKVFTLTIVDPEFVHSATRKLEAKAEADREATVAASLAQESAVRSTL
jgi:O-antigen ligase